MTRAEAISLAVCRHVAAWEAQKPRHLRPFLALCNAYNNVPAEAVTAIRAHFRAIVRTYGVKDEPPAVYWRGLRIRVPDGAEDDVPAGYDGHSLRI